MTAVAGFWSFTSSFEASAGCGQILERQKIYGPDASAIWLDAGDADVALGRCLSRILPEDIYDEQPLISQDNHRVLVADARLDNRDEIVAALGIPLDRAQGMCDAAVAMSAVERWDDSCFERLVGDYAIAWWDAKRRRLVLGRDAVGNRPLHYYYGSGFFAFASMPKGLHAISAIPCAPDEETVAEFLALLPDDGERSFFKGIKRIPAGHFGVVTPHSVSLQRHWNPSRRPLLLRSANEYAEALRHHLDIAVRSRLRGVRNAAAHLSAGLDSSSVAATAARTLRPSGGRVVAFTSIPRAGFISSFRGIHDESILAASTVALHPNMDHVLVRSEGRVPADDIERNYVLYDRPVRNLCNNVWLHAINDAMQERGLKVLLTGEMGNLTLSYGGTEVFAELFRKGRWYKLGREIAVGIRKREISPLGVFALTLGPFVSTSMWRWATRLRGRRQTWLEDYAAVTPGVANLMKRRARDLGHDFNVQPSADSFQIRLDAIRSSETGNYHKGVLGGWGIDVRDPTNDRRLIEFCLSVPTEQFRFDGIPKALVRRAMADRLPAAVLAERVKGYQSADWYERLTASRVQLSEEMERLQRCALAHRLLDLPRLQRMLRDWPEGNWDNIQTVYEYRFALLRGVSAGHFLRKAAGLDLC